MLFSLKSLFKNCLLKNGECIMNAGDKLIYLNIVLYIFKCGLFIYILYIFICYSALKSALNLYESLRINIFCTLSVIFILSS